jgi:hypothetical protein
MAMPNSEPLADSAGFGGLPGGGRVASRKPSNQLIMEEEMKDLRLQIEELEHRVVPSTLGSTLSVDVALPAAATDQGIAAPEPSAAVNEAAAAADGADGVTVS